MLMISVSNYYHLNERLVEVIFTASKTFRSWMRECSGLSVPQFRVLTFVSRNSSCSLFELAQYLGISAPSASRLVEALLLKGLISREDDKKDRRRVQLKLTTEGKNVLTGAREHVLEKLNARVNKLNYDDDMLKLSRSLDIIMLLVEDENKR
jgi:DNA-binding MarR family transcriptional regulator